MKSCNQIGIQDVSEIDINRIGQLPDYIFGVNSTLDEASGDMVDEPQLIPTERIAPHGANEFILEANNPALTVPAGQVLPAYLYNTGASVRIMPADAAHNAMFLVTKVEAGLATCQASGVVFIPEGHEYRPLTAQYYLTNGEVSTHPGGQALFTPLDEYQLLINLQEIMK